MTAGDNLDLLAIGREVFDIEIQGLEAVREQINGGFSKALEKMTCCQGRVVVCGIGKSGLVGRKIAATLSSTGTPSFFLHPVEGAHGDMGMLRPEDVVLAISNSGETEELNAILPTMKSLGPTIVAITGGEHSTMATMADIVIPVNVPREACPMGLAPTASTTATLAMGDALAVCLMRYSGFKEQDFKRVHPGGSLGQRLSMAVDEFMHTGNVPALPDAVPLGEALERLNQGGFGLVVLTDAENRVSGVVSDGDVRRMVCEGPLDTTMPVSKVMTRGPRKAHSGETASHVLDIMESHQITVLPVVSGEERFLGLVHLHDLLGKGRLKFSLR